MVTGVTCHSIYHSRRVWEWPRIYGCPKQPSAFRNSNGLNLMLAPEPRPPPLHSPLNNSSQFSIPNETICTSIVSQILFSSAEALFGMPAGLRTMASAVSSALPLMHLESSLVQWFRCDCPRFIPTSTLCSK